jgi:hypothetical protein
MSRGDRESELLDLVDAIIAADLPYVLVGGWAIAAFNQRFTTDVDAVIPAQALDEYTEFLTNRGYEKVTDVEQNALYNGRMVRFTKDIGNPVTFDAMVDVLGCRQTDAEWSYRYMSQYAIDAELQTVRPITARIPERELLFTVKLHSGRKADSRDLVVLGREVDFHRVETHLHRGDPKKLAERMDLVIDRMTEEDFEDAFKGVFQQQSVPDDDIDAVIEFLQTQRQRLHTAEE